MRLVRLVLARVRAGRDLGVVRAWCCFWYAPEPVGWLG